MYSMKYGVWDVNPLRTLLTLRYTTTINCYILTCNLTLKVVKLIDSGYRLPPPPGCPKVMYRMMIKCWYVYNFIINIIICLHCAEIIEMIIMYKDNY